MFHQCALKSSSSTQYSIYVYVCVVCAYDKNTMCALHTQCVCVGCLMRIPAHSKMINQTERALTPFLLLFRMRGFRFSFSCGAFLFVCCARRARHTYTQTHTHRIYSIIFTFARRLSHVGGANPVVAYIRAGQSERQLNRVDTVASFSEHALTIIPMIVYTRISGGWFLDGWWEMFACVCVCVHALESAHVQRRLQFNSAPRSTPIFLTRRYYSLRGDYTYQ